jgi:hypothetical protein
MNHKHGGVTDWCPRERAANVVTSAPFFALGAHVLRRGTTPETKAFGASLLGVGAAAVLYHSSAGPARPHCRQVDYLAISTSAVLLLRAVLSGDRVRGAQEGAPAEGEGHGKRRRGRSVPSTLMRKNWPKTLVRGRPNCVSRGALLRRRRLLLWPTLMCLCLQSPPLPAKEAAECARFCR